LKYELHWRRPVVESGHHVFCGTRILRDVIDYVYVFCAFCARFAGRYGVLRDVTDYVDLRRYGEDTGRY